MMVCFVVVVVVVVVASLLLPLLDGPFWGRFASGLGFVFGRFNVCVTHK